MINLDDMKRIELEMMKEIHAFCLAHNVVYSLGYGTLLGAVRHKGFIPWDDDIDLIMPRPDYDMFIRTFESEHYKAVSSQDPQYHYPYMKVYDTRTYLDEELRHTYPDMGVFIDIFPVDGLPSNRKQRESFYKRQKFLYKLHMSMKYYISKDWSLAKNMLLFVARGISLFLPLRKVIKKLEKNYFSYPYENSPDVAVMVGEVGLVPIPRSAFDHPVLLEFEDTSLYAISDYEEYLTGLYGDYMKLPSLENQSSEHRYKVGWK